MSEPYKIEPPMKWARKFKVQIPPGRKFPIDMLRYDRCSPASSHDVMMMLETLNSQHREPVTIEMVSYCSHKHGNFFTKDRWKSFDVQIIE